MFLAPILTVKVGWYGLVTTPILSGDLPCSICGEMRGGLVNVGLGKCDRDPGEGEGMVLSGLITTPILSGYLPCSICGEMRGGWSMLV